MKRINKKLLEALDKLIAKYSGEELEYIHSHMNCPLCDLFYISPFNRKKHNDCCKGCPNMYFAIRQKDKEYIIGCDDRTLNIQN